MRNLYNFIKVGTWNIEGAYFKVNNYYINKLREPEFLSNLDAHDILCVQETHCGPNDIPAQHIKDFHPIPHCRDRSGNNRYFGGMLLLIRKSIRKGVKISYTGDPDILGITLRKEFFNLHEDIFIWFAYASPANSPYNIGKDNVMTKLETLMAAHNGHYQAILGDLNGRTSSDADFINEEYDNHSPLQDISSYVHDTPLERNNMDKNPVDGHGKMILNLCKNLQVRILNGRTSGDRWGVPTRYPLHRKEKPSVIDYGICSGKLRPFVNSFYVLPHTILSDHCCISLSLSVNFQGNEEEEKDIPTVEKERDTLPPFKVEFLDKFQQHLKDDRSFDNLRSRIQQFNDSSTITQADIDTMAECFQIPIMENAKISFPAKKILPRKKKSTQISKPTKWFDLECTKAKNRLKRASKNLNKNPYDSNVQQLFVAARKVYKRTCKAAEAKSRENLLNKLLNAEDPKEFWNMVNDMKGWGREKVDPCDTIPSEEWTNHFKNLLNTDKRDNRSPTPPTTNPNPTTEIRITMKEMKEVLSRSKIRKARGPDGTLMEYFKFAPDNVLKALLDLMNIIFSSATYPTSWSVNFLKPIYKSGPTEDPGNYRGLAIGSALAKLYSMILLNRLETFVTEHNIISMCQIGFRKLFRTADHIYVLKTIINMKMTKGEKLYAAFIDFRKAYDTVNRDKMLQQLQKIGAGSKFIENIRSIYEKVQYAIKVKGKVMDPILSNLGLKQGCPLSPLLFNLYINDIAKYLDKDSKEPKIVLQGVEITHFLYADDLVIVSPTKKGLQEKLDNLSLFAKDKDLTINTKKSQVMIFNKSGRLLKDHFTIDGKELQIVRSYTYLGIDIPASGSFNLGMTQMNSKAKKAMMPLFTTIMQFNIPFHKALQLFQTYVEPILLYNAENFAAMTEKQIEKCKDGRLGIYDIATSSQMTTTQMKFIKFILGVGKQCPNMAVLGEAAVLPLLLRAQIQMLKYWDRIRNMGDNTLVKLAYKENVQSNSTWCKTIQVLNTSFDLHTRGWTSIQFQNRVKKTIKTHFTNYWKIRISNRDIEKKLDLYSRVKEGFEVQKYLSLPKFKDRQIISKLLCSSHKLRIETGRWKQDETLREERICKICQTNKVEDEDHFIMECPAYDQIRRESAIDFENYTTTEAIFHVEDPVLVAEFLRQAYSMRDKITSDASDTYQIVEKSSCGMKLRLCKGKSIPGQMTVQKLTKDGLKLKISRTTSLSSPFGNQI